MRDAFSSGRLIKRIVADLRELFNVADARNVDVLNLWDDKDALQPFGVQYREFDDGVKR